MQEKDMVYDILGGLKSSLGTYAKVISECSNQNLREKFQQMRDGDEKGQYDLYKIAEQKGYYNPSPAATPMQCDEIKGKLAMSGNTSLG